MYWIYRGIHDIFGLYFINVFPYWLSLTSLKCFTSCIGRHRCFFLIHSKSHFKRVKFSFLVNIVVFPLMLWTEEALKQSYFCLLFQLCCKSINFKQIDSILIVKQIMCIGKRSWFVVIYTRLYIWFFPNNQLGFV